jgi:hypothetical protein
VAKISLATFPARTSVPSTSHNTRRSGTSCDGSAVPERSLEGKVWR